MSQKFRRFIQLFQYGIKDAEMISQMQDVNLSKSEVFRDILNCYFKYNIRSITYRKKGVWQLSPEQREEIGKLSQKREDWEEDFYENYRFLIKWSSFKYEGSAKLQLKRMDAYYHRYNLGKHCFIGHGVLFHRHHYTDGFIKVGDNCHFSEDVNIDYTGGLTLGYKVGISEGAKIFTHNHVVDFSGVDDSKGCIQTPLIIHDRAWIGARAMIMPGVTEIGRGAVISADTCVKTKIPPYAIVMGNPAKIVGFRLLPKEIVEREKELYPEDQRLSLETLQANYQKYYFGRKKEIKEWNRI
jgi:acetyltransferase-like isoleucine patch superfamily enzyme